MAEIGLDSRRNGEQAQADALSWQIDATFASGCAGAYVFAWTDEWHRGGHDIEDWDFGLVDRHRQPKPADGLDSDRGRERATAGRPGPPVRPVDRQTGATDKQQVIPVGRTGR